MVYVTSLPYNHIIYVPEWESKSTLELNGAKSTNYIKKYFK